MKLYLKGERCFTPKCAIVKRNYPPGAQGTKKGFRQRLTPYGVQLREKQKARFYYGISESQFRNYFEKASSKTGILLNFFDAPGTATGQHRVSARTRLVQKRRTATCWSWVNPGERKKVTIPSYQVRVGDVISVKPSAAANKHFSEILPNLEKHTPPEWLTTEKSDGNVQGKVVSVPSKPGDLSAIFDMKPIIEFYSRQ